MEKDVGAKSNMGVRNQVRKRGKIGFKRFLIYIQLFVSRSPQFLFAPLQLIKQ